MNVGVADACFIQEKNQMETNHALLVIKTHSSKIRNYFKCGQTRAGRAAVRRGSHVPGEWELLDRYYEPFATLGNWLQTYGWDATTQGTFGKQIKD